MPIFDHLHEPYLERLAAAGVEPEAVEYVLITHLHADHVGWSTRWVAERWVPTFPYATYVFSALEQKYCSGLASGDARVEAALAEANLGTPVGTPVPGVYADSVAPTLEIYQPDLVSMFREFPEAARTSRRWMLNHAVKSGAIYFSSHLPETSVGRITGDKGQYQWHFV